MSGTLYVVATPIGNLGDMTARAREVLSGVETVLCEDTRHTKKLLLHFEIDARTLSYHEHNEIERTPRVLALLAQGMDVALVSDAGTPLVSDPGYRLVRACRKEGFPIRSIPGASSLTAAIAVSGLPTSSFLFMGFLPRKGAARTRAMGEIISCHHTVVLFEAANRLARLLDAIGETDPDRPACVLREMTKRFEEHRDGTVYELSLWAKSEKLKGEITLVVGPSAKTPEPPSDALLASAFRELKEKGASPREASKQLAKKYGGSARELYQRYAR